MEDLVKLPSKTEGGQKKKKTSVNTSRKKGAVDALKTTKNYVDKENDKARKKADVSLIEVCLVYEKINVDWLSCLRHTLMCPNL